MLVNKLSLFLNIYLKKIKTVRTCCSDWNKQSLVNGLEFVVMGELWEYVIDDWSLCFISRWNLHFAKGDKSVGNQIKAYPRQYIGNGIESMW